MCNGLDAISSGGVSTGTGFHSVAKPDLHSAMLMVKRTNKRCWDCYVLERGRFGGGNCVGWSGKMGDQKTHFVVMQAYFNALYRRRLVTSCHTISPLFLHIKSEVIFGINLILFAFFVLFLFFVLFVFILSFLKGVDILSRTEINVMCR